MSKELMKFESKRSGWININTSWGGFFDDGSCLQIDGAMGYIQFTVDEVYNVLSVLNDEFGTKVYNEIAFYEMAIDSLEKIIERQTRQTADDLEDIKELKDEIKLVKDAYNAQCQEMHTLTREYKMLHNASSKRQDMNEYLGTMVKEYGETIEEQNKEIKQLREAYHKQSEKLNVFKRDIAMLHQDINELMLK